jgi:hypothetical protein
MRARNFLGRDRAARYVRANELEVTQRRLNETPVVVEIRVGFERRPQSTTMSMRAATT